MALPIYLQLVTTDTQPNIRN